MLVTYRTTPHLIHHVSRQVAKPWCDLFLESECLRRDTGEQLYCTLNVKDVLSVLCYTALGWPGYCRRWAVGMLGYCEVGGLHIGQDEVEKRERSASFGTDERHILMWVFKIVSHTMTLDR
jgi:hypothetical protein